MKRSVVHQTSDDTDEGALRVWMDAGFEGATTIVRGRARMGVDPLRVPRVHLLNQHHLLQFWLKLETRYGDRP